MTRSNVPLGWEPGPAGVAAVADLLRGIPYFAATPFIRPWHLRWGATADEVTGSMRGDELLRRAQYAPTRAITIEAPPAAVWPWLAQVDYGRAG